MQISKLRTAKPRGQTRRRRIPSQWAFVGLLVFVGLLAAMSLSMAVLHPPVWRPLPHVNPRPRRSLLLGGGSAAAVSGSWAVGAGSPGALRTAVSVDWNAVIPVWPTWGGGRVVPIMLEDAHDPFLLLAHHKHWFDPRDPLRAPFRAIGGALGLPYVDVEGFPGHPHRGFDILTYVIDGSDGFRHRDSLGRQRTYRGGSAQWMRTGAGVFHEEFFETRDDKRTDIELFQIWINLPKNRKLDPPAVQYVGGAPDAFGAPWREHVVLDAANRSTSVRDIGATLDVALAMDGSAGEGGTRAASGNGDGAASVAGRPRVGVLHATLRPRAEWTPTLPRGDSALLYIREGEAEVHGPGGSTLRVGALHSATFANDGDALLIRNARDDGPLDVLLLSGEPLREPVARRGPIVMNTQEEVTAAFSELRKGTFLGKRPTRLA